MVSKLGWLRVGKQFADGSFLRDWRAIARFGWWWQYDDHELAFTIYEHSDAFWKLYQFRTASTGSRQHIYTWGGVACQVVEVSYLRQAGSPHSNRLMAYGDREWVRNAEFDPSLHELVKQDLNKLSQNGDIKWKI